MKNDSAREQRPPTKNVAELGSQSWKTVQAERKPVERSKTSEMLKYCWAFLTAALACLSSNKARSRLTQGLLI